MSTFTVYGLLSTATPAGPWYTSGDFSAISGANPSVGSSIFAFFTGAGDLKTFYSSNGAGLFGAIALPTLTTPNAVPPGFTQIGTGAIWTNLSAYPFGASTSNTGGSLYFAVLPGTGSPDVGSPTQFQVDIFTVFLIASAVAEQP